MNEEPTNRLPDSRDDTLAQILSAVQNLSSRVEGLERKVDERLYDTRPVWEKVQADITELQEGQKSLSERMETLRDEVRTGFRNLKRQFSVLHDTFLEVRADYKELDKRVYQLEEERT